MKHVSEYFSEAIETGRYTAYLPEKVLLAAVLERAYRDLSAHVNPRYRREAIAWFENLNPINGRGFTFVNVLEMLELSAGQINILFEKVERAKKYEKKSESSASGQTAEAQRKSKGIGVGSFFKGTWRRVSPEDFPIQRKRRFV